MSKMHNIQNIKVDTEYLRFAIDGKTYQLRWQDCSPRLAKATFAQRKHFEVSPGAYGVHWPEIDEDLAITPLLEQAEGNMVHQVGEKKSRYRAEKN